MKIKKNLIRNNENYFKNTFVYLRSQSRFFLDNFKLLWQILLYLSATYTCVHLRKKNFLHELKYRRRKKQFTHIHFYFDHVNHYIKSSEAIC